VPVDRIEFGTPHGPDSITSINLLGRKVLPWFSWNITGQILPVQRPDMETIQREDRQETEGI